MWRRNEQNRRQQKFCDQAIDPRSILVSKMIKPSCQICEENQHKYKCPACEIKYCSVPCFKKHKEECVPKEKESKKDNSDQTATSVDPACDRENSPPVDSGEDRVPKKSLQLLGQSDELKSLLENPHLRTLLTSLDSSANPAQDIATAMQIPIFTEFADTCLSIMDTEDKAPLILSGQSAKQL
ncbi:zinc finger HIT domain-containing protein 3-like [Liolophura sinensis]|uniref:zinc finger HIT domain-containing protein 3-like n=1 Tax=Liolophura sinensis TaxID=3198878 RepID=UPI003158EB1C